MGGDEWVRALWEAPFECWKIKCWIIFLTKLNSINRLRRQSNLQTVVRAVALGPVKKRDRNNFYMYCCGVWTRSIDVRDQPSGRQPGPRTLWMHSNGCGAGLSHALNEACTVVRAPRLAKCSACSQTMCGSSFAPQTKAPGTLTSVCEHNSR